MNLVILASGLGSRLAPLTNHIPKFLVNTGKETGLVEQINYWKSYTPSSITLVVHSKYAELTKAYFDMYFKGDEDLLVSDDAGGVKPTPIFIKTIDEALGSAHAIMNSCQHLVGKQVLFSWCDIVPGEVINMDYVMTLGLGKPVVITNYEYENRYGLVEGGSDVSGHRGLIPAQVKGGGVVGLYYIPEFNIVQFENGEDFVDVITKLSPTGFVEEYAISKIIDWGDKPKLFITRSNADKARSFNAVEFQGSLVHKYALNRQGETLIAREIEWYKVLEERNSKVSRPKVWFGRGADFVMSRVHSSTSIAEHWPQLDEIGRANVLKSLADEMAKLHDTEKIRVPNDIVIRDVNIEARTKLLNRFKEIEGVINAFGPVRSVGGVDITGVDPIELINWTADQLVSFYKDVDTYNLIHGDLQFSNSMINVNNHQITLIDPRGYFGQTALYGLPDYDYSKLLYALSGYDGFNYSKTFHISLENGELNFDIQALDLTGCESSLPEGVQSKATAYWLAVIWQGLAQYIKNDPVKSVAAHYHGLRLMHLLRKFGD